MLNLVSASFILLPVIFFLKVKNINHFLLFGVIFFNVFIFKGYGIIDEFFLFLSIVRILHLEYKNKEITINNLKNNLYDSFKSLKNNYLNLVFLILFIYYLILSIEGVLIYDYRVVRFSLFFVLLLFYLIYSDKFNFNKLNLNDCIFITRISILTFFLYLLQGYLLEIFNTEYLSRYHNTQGVFVAGSSAAFSILFLTTIPAIKIYKYKPITSSIFLIILLLNVQFFDSRVGTVVLFVLLIINFYKKIHVFILCYIIATFLNIFLEFTSYLMKYDKKYTEMNKICLNKDISLKEKQAECLFLLNQTRVLYAIERLDRKYWQSREVITGIKVRYVVSKIKKLEIERNTLILVSADQKKSIKLMNLEKDISKHVNILRKLPAKFIKDKKILKDRSINIIDSESVNILDSESVNILDSESVNILDSESVISLLNTAGLKVLTESSKGLIKENIVINPSLSDYDRMLPVAGSINLILFNDNFFRSLFGYGFYSHKTELVEPINNLIGGNANFFKEYSNRYVSKVHAPIRTANLPAIITDGGILLIILYFFIFLLIGVRILRNFRLKNWQVSINQIAIIGFIFFLNYINFNLDNVFIYLILLNPNHFTKFSFDE